ncbi:MAG: noncanonical pyrimidine nucleotidase, YjjG family [Ruminococcaceae bacterium]|nr:noncanonical pyrimidine nucleotidase, YjjG family [Oscillospiraceae bacterium]
MKYRFILLDADNTLLDFDACEKEAFRRTMEDIGIPFSETLYERYSAINLACWKELERKEITRTELQTKRYSLLAAECSLALDPAQTNARYISHLSTISVLIPGALSFVKTLSQKAELYIITNGLACVQIGRFHNNPITPYIRKIFISESLGASKPDRLFFEQVAMQIPDFDHSNAIVIGDSLTSDIRGANNAGLSCIWYNPKGNKRGNEIIDYEVSNYSEILNILEQGDFHEN